MSRKMLWALTVEAPASAVEQVMAQLPEKAVGESAFIKDADDRRADPLWVIQALYKELPEKGAMEVALAILAQASGASIELTSCAQVPTEGWVEKNQASYPPLAAGRLVLHGSRDRAKIMPSQIGIEMDVSCAFGTGEHPTTQGCLMALQSLKKIGPRSRVLDVGTGTGVLAIAASKLYGAACIASDMDAPSVEVARRNIAKNGERARVRALQAVGVRNALIRKKGPYDLILSNIFAGPLAALAPAFKVRLKQGGHLILAGFLHRDCNRVRLAYAGQGIFLQQRLRFGHWSILILKKR
jgi:ribosomal protein L11 methyltransferase